MKTVGPEQGMIAVEGFDHLSVHEWNNLAIGYTPLVSFYQAPGSDELGVQPISSALYLTHFHSGLAIWLGVYLKLWSEAWDTHTHVLRKEKKGLRYQA